MFDNLFAVYFFPSHHVNKNKDHLFFQGMYKGLVTRIHLGSKDLETSWCLFSSSFFFFYKISSWHKLGKQIEHHSHIVGYNSVCVITF